MVLDLTRQAELHRSRCAEIINDLMNLKTVIKLFLQESNGFAVNIPELKLIRQYHNDVVKWRARLNTVLGADRKKLRLSVSGLREKTRGFGKHKFSTGIHF
ncbi:lysine-specific demethylase 5A isoform X4 [Cucumis melo var. makuwa]|uniref:Lysine-specific demethylase 5A isoform X4 n=1 Tax=Cucumis melo var. makuwa TaxID=1194695 RepID=A0A5D3DNC6_CUCMM|nr:lysine-specific demethylase 5A isoform X4 [Cucumis melo var. makuwa]TYK24809.1 lysine-specific demethylase 5A isoform X4 [Cucumis melo var. makuwa]